MFTRIKLISLVAGALMAAVAVAQTPASAPAGSTGLCRDGSYWSGAVKKGACRGHKGVQDWYSSDAGAGGSTTPSATGARTTGAAATTAASAGAPAAATAAAIVPPAAPAASHTSAPAASKSTGMPTEQAPGGGPGMVWVNNSSKVYHCSTDRWYGKTKNGSYMSEADAVAKGNRAEHGKACK